MNDDSNTPAGELKASRRQAIRSAKARKEYEKSRVFERIPIVKGYILREVKNDNS